MHGNTGWRFEFFPVKSWQDSDVVICSTCGCDEAVILIDHLYEMSNDQRYGLNSLELFFGSELLSFKLDLIVLDVVFLDVKELHVSIELLEFAVKVLLLSPCRVHTSCGLDAL